MSEDWKLLNSITSQKLFLLKMTANLTKLILKFDNPVSDLSIVE